MTKLGDLYDLEVDEDGKVKVRKNEAKRLKKLNVSQRIAARKSTKQKWRKAGEVSDA